MRLSGRCGAVFIQSSQHFNQLKCVTCSETSIIRIRLGENINRINRNRQYVRCTGYIKLIIPNGKFINLKVYKESDTLHVVHWIHYMGIGNLEIIML